MTTHKQLIYIILDGVGDNGHVVESLGNRTPLGAAATPHLDRLVAAGQLGLLEVVEGGIAPQSDQGVFALLGYPKHIYPGRGVVEALGAKVEVPEGGIALRVNFASAGAAVDGSVWILDRRAGRNTTTQESRALERELNATVDLTSIHPHAASRFVATEEHRGVLVIWIPGVELSPLITNTDPGYARQGLISPAVPEGRYAYVLQPARVIAELDALVPAAQRAAVRERAELAARLVNAFTEQSRSILGRSAVNHARLDKTRERLTSLRLAGVALDRLFAGTKTDYDQTLARITAQLNTRGASTRLDHWLFPPANLLVARDAGARPRGIPTLREKYGPITFSAIVQMPVEVGMAALTGMAVIELPPTKSRPSEEDLRVNYGQFVDAVRTGLGTADALYLHIKGPDLPGHDGDPEEKRRIIEAIDRFFFGPLLPQVDLTRTVVAVTADHSTPAHPAIKSHTGEPVPVLVATAGLPPDSSRRFTEAEAERMIRSGEGLGRLLGVELLPRLIQLTGRS